MTFSGQGCSMEQMQQIRDQQESLARLHFELGARQETQRDPFSDDGLLRANNEVCIAIQITILSTFNKNNITSCVTNGPKHRKH